MNKVRFVIVGDVHPATPVDLLDKLADDLAGHLGSTTFANGQITASWAIVKADSSAAKGLIVPVGRN